MRPSAPNWTTLRSKPPSASTGPKSYAVTGPGAMTSTHVEIETLNWVDCFNHERHHDQLDTFTPALVCRGD